NLAAAGIDPRRGNRSAASNDQAGGVQYIAPGGKGIRIHRAAGCDTRHIQVRVEADRDLGSINGARLRYRNVTRPGEGEVTTRLDVQCGTGRTQEPDLPELLLDREERAFRSGAASVHIDAVVPGHIHQPDNRTPGTVNQDGVDASLDGD